jgi:hypothetical protein
MRSTKPLVLWAPDFGGSVLDVVHRQQQLVRMSVGQAAELPAVVREHHATLKLHAAK